MGCQNIAFTSLCLAQIKFNRMKVKNLMLGGDEILGLYEPQVSLHINMPREVA